MSLFKLSTRAALLFATSFLAAVSGAAANKDPALPVPGSDALGGEHRPLVFLVTDKPIYKPGETVYARLVALQADTFFPVRDPGQASFKITGPRQNEVAQQYAALTDSTAGFAWQIPEGTAGGRYEASAEFQGSPTAVRPFEVRAYIPPRLKSQIEFLREGYGPGDKVSAVINVNRAEGGVPQGAKLTAVARVDGQEVARIEGISLDAEGNGQATFTLPANIEQGEGTLAFIIEDGGLVETATKTIPILTQNMVINFYPESGELITGLPTRVYIEAKRPDGKPADITGQLVKVDKSGQIIGEPVAQVSTLHEGRGITEFTPLPSTNYAVRLTQPAGIDKLYPLPQAKTSGAVIRPEKQVFAFNEPVELSIRSTADSKAAYITLYQREKQVALAHLKAGENRVSLTPGEAEGVLMATVWDQSGKPLAERLIFREPKFAVKINITQETTGSPVPGGKVRLKIATTDKNDQPVEAVVGLAVTDDALLEMVETRDQAPSLPAMVLLENEVQDLADAAVYFDPTNPDAARDIDLLLGIQGWRRFVLVQLDQALANNPDAVRRALAIRVIPVVVKDRRMVKAGAVFAMQKNVDNIDFMVADPPLELMEMPVVEEEKPMLQAVPAMPIKQAEPNEAFEILDIRQAQNQDIMIAGDIAAKPMMRRELIAVREYAHAARANRQPNDRRDFTETIYWNAGLRTSPRDGTATVEFDLPDSVTTFKVRTDAFGNNGALGQGTADIISLEPFYVEPKLPPSLLTGDRPLIPVTLVNSTAQTLNNVGLLPKAEDGLKVTPAQVPTKLGANARERVLLNLTADKPGVYALTLNTAAGPYADTVTRPLTVLPRGFPIKNTDSGLIGPGKPFKTKIAIAQDAAPGSITGTIKVYPTPLANMEEALNALLRQPHGCFEQTSSTSYPLVMAQQYFMSHQGISPDKIKEADKLLKQSYEKLIGFETPEKGYEWFGANPGHEALTAYGLMQFMEMKQVRPVDDAMIARTQNWLMSRRDGQGGFKRNERALDSFGAAPAPLTNLYILWTLLESGQKPDQLKVELAAAKKTLSNNKDPYLQALGANIFYLAGDLNTAKALATDLRAAVAANGSLTGAETSITRSGGESLNIETTSLAILAWLRMGETFAGDVEKSMAWLFEQCKAGRFGSTQSTILALKAITAYDKARSKPKAPGNLQLVIDGKNFGSPLAFDQNSQGALELPDFAVKLTPGEHTLELVMTGGGEMPFALETGYYANTPENSPESPLTLSTSLSASKIKEGEPVDLNVTITAKEGDMVSMPLAIIGLPAGLEPRHERLKEMKAAGQIDAYEILGRELVLYWRGFKGGEKVELTIPMTAEIPGFYTAPASRVYSYYLEEHKNWTDGESIEITPR